MYKQIQHVGHEYIIIPSGVYMITWWIYSDGTVDQCKQFFLMPMPEVQK